MLAISTTPNDASLLNIAGHLLQETPSKVSVASELTGMIRPENSSWNDCLRVANMLLNNRQIDQAKRLIAGIDADKCFQQASSALQINLLLRAMVFTGEGDAALFLLESGNMAERFSVFDDMNIRLRSSNLFLSQGEIAKAQTLLADVDAEKYIEQATSTGQVKLIFSVLFESGQADVVLSLFNASTIFERFGEEFVIDLKLFFANEIILNGKNNDAKRLISNIDPCKINSPQHFYSLGMLCNCLGLFKEAVNMYAVLEDKKVPYSKQHVNKSIAYICQNKFDEAEMCISQEMREFGESARTLFWQARLLNLIGHNHESLEPIKKLLANFAMVPTHKCFALVEKGNALRSMEKLDESLICYHDSSRISTANPIWLMIAHFEYAITLAYAGKRKEALDVATGGHGIKYQRIEENYNPCSILRQFLLYRRDKATKLVPTPDEWVDYAKSWPYPFLPYHIWMLLLTFGFFYLRGDYSSAWNVLKAIIDSSGFIPFDKIESLNRAFHANRLCSNTGFIDLLSTTICEHRFLLSFEHNIISHVIQGLCDA